MQIKTYFLIVEYSMLHASCLLLCLHSKIPFSLYQLAGLIYIYIYKWAPNLKKFFYQLQYTLTTDCCNVFFQFCNKSLRIFGKNFFKLKRRPQIWIIPKLKTFFLQLLQRNNIKSSIGKRLILLRLALYKNARNRP